MADRNKLIRHWIKGWKKNVTEILNSMDWDSLHNKTNCVITPKILASNDVSELLDFL
jgi:hypothetical protein